MSIEAISWAFNLSLPNSGIKLTLLALCNYANEDGEAYPSQKALAEKTCLCERAIRTHLVALEDIGLIARKARTRANGSFTSDLFQINVGAKPNGINCQRQILPTAENDTSQRQILPKPAADSAVPETSLTTTITKTNPSAPAKADALPCPVEKIIEAYHEAMPLNPVCKVLNESRRRAVRQRWREASSLTCKPFGYTTQADGLQAWRRFFEVCADSNFLTGKVAGRNGGPPFFADVDFLFSPSGFVRALENKYHRGA